MSKYPITRDDLEGLGEHALLHPIPKPCQLPAHWLIANAASIVKAMDCHTELVAALEETIDYMARVNPKHEDSITVKRVRALIAKAKGQQ